MEINKIKFLQEKKELIIKAVSEVNAIVLTEILNNGTAPHNFLELSISSSGRCISLNIYDAKTNQQVEKAEVWCVDQILFEGAFRFDQEGINKRVKENLKELENMKALALKYAKLNK
jgi:hypothetical protein